MSFNIKNSNSFSIGFNKRTISGDTRKYVLKELLKTVLNMQSIIEIIVAVRGAEHNCLQGGKYNGQSVKVTIEGTTETPFWKPDLKMEVVKDLLETADKEEFFEDGIEEEFHLHIQEIRELLDAIKR
ncbi:hypothetical protein [Cytobacillus sp.]|uniref:hypothetical protein n=1 Tax=Cytobacillus sp. TaxID=2675269 RepID=UPI0035127314